MPETIIFLWQLIQIIVLTSVLSVIIGTILIFITLGIEAFNKGRKGL